MLKSTQAKTVVLSSILLLFMGMTNAQERPLERLMGDPSTALWLGTYTNVRFSEKLFWAGETHVRTNEYNGVRYTGRMGQIYNRHGIKYLYSKNLSATFGGVLRLNFSPDPGNREVYRGLVLEPRIWHEYLFAMPFPRFMLYHRLRVEHRWSRSNAIGDEFIYRNRWRYKILMKVPLNNPTLVPGTFYFSPDIELIMQSGKSVIDSPMEDLRFYGMIGYIQSPQVSYSLGMAYTIGQDINAGYDYNTRWLLRLNAYISLDFRKFEEKIPKINIRD